MRYLIALIVAALVILSLAVFTWLTYRTFEDHTRQKLREQKEAGQMPVELQNIDIESADIWRDVKVKIPPALLSRLDFALFIAKRWYIWAPAVVALCLGIAALVGRWRKQL